MSAQDYKDRIVELVRRSWEQARRPLLLSQLGNEDGGAIARHARETEEGGLEKYIRACLHTEIGIISHSGNPKVKYALPADSGIDAGVGHDRIIEEAYAAPSKPRFIPAFWAAFRNPLEPEKRRYLHPSRPVRFEDMDSLPDDVDAGFVEIERKYIAAHRATDKKEVFDNIKTWLNDHNYPADKWTIPEQIDMHRRGAENLLEKILVSLKEDDLQRMTIPMDIIRKLKGISI